MKPYLLLLLLLRRERVNHRHTTQHHTHTRYAGWYLLRRTGEGDLLRGEKLRLLGGLGEREKDRLLRPPP